MQSRAANSAPSRLVRHRAVLPGVQVLQLSLDGALSRSVPHRYGTVLHLEGESVWSVSGTRYATRPGTVGVKVPGEVYAEHARSGRSRFQVLVFDDALIDEARVVLERPLAVPRARSFDGLRDPCVRPLMALHQAIHDQASTNEKLEETLSDALATLVQLTSLPSARSERSSSWSGAVARAHALLEARLTESVTLDELAAHARLDKFRLCRAFRDHVGLPPHAYVTHRRVSLAQELLALGVSQTEVAVRVGLYDQSQLHRHFKRVLGVTPGAYVRAVR